MTRLRRFDDRALAGRVKRLRRSEGDLQARLQASIGEAERAGRWPATDTACKHFSGLLRKVRLDLRDAENEQARRRTSRAGAVKPLSLTRNGRVSSVLGPKLS
jgi:hypothetical protein